ncbi:hypothetical protein BKA62DRAFT_830342 [Auriculariales sp. MPI-PUGE-AT-0066]|nr:hypothetical protein BKA62DRAFT_830342 [Auriculariales sp. MPI-PUGE-AT-0066]
MRFNSLFALVATVASLGSSLAAPTVSTTSEAQLKAANLGLGDILNLLGVGFVTKVNTFITLATLDNNLVSLNFDVKNPLPIELTIDSISSKASVNGTVYVDFTHTFTPPLIVPILGTANSGNITNVLLVQGAIPSLDIIPLGYVDLPDTDAKVRAATILGHLGIPIELDNLKQTNVTATYTLDLS